MVYRTPYVHWKIKQQEEPVDIDPVYLWGTVIETDKGPIDEPVFITEPEQAKKIFNYNLDPFFANGGRYAVVVRAYAGEPKKASFDITLDKDFSYVYVDYDYYTARYSFKSYSDDADAVFWAEGTVQATGKTSNGYTEVEVLTNTVDNFIGNKYWILSTANPNGTTKYPLLGNPDPYAKTGIAVTMESLSGDNGIKAKVKLDSAEEEASIKPILATEQSANPVELDVAFFQGRWRLCEENGEIKYFYHVDGVDSPLQATGVPVKINGKFYKEGTTEATATEENEVQAITKSFNESDVKKIIIAKLRTISANTPVINLEAVYEGDYLVPVTVAKDIRTGYRVSVKDSENYTIMVSGATTLRYIEQRINERAENVVATITEEGRDIQTVFTSSLIPAVDSNKDLLPEPSESSLNAYTAIVEERGLPVGSIFALPEDEYEFRLTEIVSYLADGSNGSWDSTRGRILEADRLEAHQNALDHLATIKLSGIFCNYGEDELQRVYINHVSVSEPEGMNSAEVCKWRTLIIGANASDRTNSPGEQPGFKMMDKAASIDNENVLFLGQGLIDDGFIPNDAERAIDTDLAASDFQLLPFQTTQYIAGLRSKLFYGDAIFGGEAKKAMRGLGNMTIAPLFNGENKLLWQPDNYAALNEAGVLTFTEEYNILSLTDGVTTRQSPLEEDEEAVQSIIKYAKHGVHEVLQEFIGQNMLGPLETSMEQAIQGVLTIMQTQDQTLVNVPTEGLVAFNYDVVLVPKSNAKQVLAKAYVYLKLTPVHALRQIEVELTVQ